MLATKVGTQTDGGGKQETNARHARGGTGIGENGKKRGKRCIKESAGGESSNAGEEIGEVSGKW